MKRNLNFLWNGNLTSKTYHSFKNPVTVVVMILTENSNLLTLCLLDRASL